MRKITHGSLFSGVGGFDIAAHQLGWENVFHCEWNRFGQTVLKHYWPNSIHHNDITKTDFTIYRGTIDIISGGFPCQPYSQAGKRLGKDDDRHLWPEMRRAIREIAPTFVVGENVRGLINWNAGLVFHEVQADLEAEGYEVQPFLLPAAGVDAPHERFRIFFIAYSERCRYRGRTEETGLDIADGIRQLLPNLGHHGNPLWSETERCGTTVTNSEGEWSRGLRDTESTAGTRESYELSRSQCGVPHSHGLVTNPISDGPQNGCEETRGAYGCGSEGGMQQPEREGVFVANATSNGNNGDSGTMGGTPETTGQKNDGDVTECGSPITPDSASHRCERQGESVGGEQNDGFPNGKSNEHDQIGTARTWNDFPTQPPVCFRDDGFPRRLARYLSDLFVIQDTEKINGEVVWDAINQEGVWERISELYKIKHPVVLLQAVLIYDKDYKREEPLSAFADVFTEPLAKLLEKVGGKFSNTNNGKAIATARESHTDDILKDVPHELLMATKMFEKRLSTFETYHRTESIKAAGNAVVPPLIIPIFKAIQEYINTNTNIDNNQQQ